MLGALSALIWSACIPEDEIQGVITECREVVDEAVAGAIDECGETVDQAIVDAQDVVWERCSAYYEDEVLPEIEQRLQDALDEAVGDLEMWFELQLETAKDQVFEEIGCTADEVSPFGYDCRDSVICVDPELIGPGC